MRYFLKTYGCQMNFHDSELISGVLESFGFQAGKLEEADLIILNTCSVRDRAEQKVRTFLGDLRKMKSNHPRVCVGVMGCMVARAREYFQKLSFIDFLLNPEELDSFPVVLASVLRERKMPVPEKLPPLRYLRRSSVTAYVNIILGCNNFCSYCVVPFVRGRERSRPPEEILKEVREVADCGFPEVMLLGQNVNAYGKEIPGWNFERLLEEISKIEGILRIRYTTSHPRDFTESLVLKIKGLPHVCEHFHLPVQSGSNKVLKSMKRGYSREQYLELVSFIREEIPNSSITTDLIVGYPEEGEEEFMETADLMEKVRFDSAYILTYSPRPGTSAFALGDPIPQKEKMRRLYYLQEKQKEHALFRNLNLKGKTVEVLVEGKDPQGHLVGRTRTNKEVFFQGEDALMGKLVQVKIEEVTPWSLRGRIS
jgi:tRNA-2-methylthio-N6-dimethylallyladenosine synthase